MRTIVLPGLILLVSLLQAQSPKYQSLGLSEHITRNAEAVVLLDETDIVVSSDNKMEVNIKRKVTVLNESGNKAVRNYAFYDGTTKLKDLYAEIYDAQGNSIEKIKKKDFKDVAAVDGFSLYTDSRYKYFLYTPKSYPYTAEFSYSYTTSNTAFLPPWTPLDEYGVGVQKSSYKLEYPEGENIRVKEKNFDGLPITKESLGNTLEYNMDATPAILKEMMSPEFFEFGPRLLLALDKFHLEGIDGYGNEWKSFGKWQYDNLIQNQDFLPQETIVKMGNLLKGITDPLEKTKRIYEYVQNNTRYISVQLGIGGWMPISAEEVDRLKYGDCKGLTNYTKALLKSQGIESYYSVVWAGDSKRSIETDFASMQGNHVILNVPLEERDIWLECTSQKIPFGFLGDFTDDRDVLMITPQGGVLKRTDSYSDDDNRKLTTAIFKITEQGNLEAKVSVVCEGIEYDQRSRIAGFSEKEKDEFYKRYWSNLNGLGIASMKYENNREKVKFLEEIALQSPSYGDKIGDDLLFKINPFDVNNFVPTRYRNRKQPFQVQRGFVHEAHYTIEIPEGLNVSNLPAPIHFETDYGTYSMEVKKMDDGHLSYKRELAIKKGDYPKEKYQDYRDFRRKVAKSDNLKIVLSK